MAQLTKAQFKAAFQAFTKPKRPDTIGDKDKDNLEKAVDDATASTAPMTWISKPPRWRAGPMTSIRRTRSIWST